MGFSVAFSSQNWSVITADSSVQALVRLCLTDGTGIGGQSEQIYSESGQLVKTEFSQYLPLRIGYSVITKGGSLQVPYLIHAVTGEPGKPITESGLRKALYQIFMVAESNKFNHLVLEISSFVSVDLPDETISQSFMEVVRKAEKECSFVTHLTVTSASDTKSSKWIQLLQTALGN